MPKALHNRDGTKEYIYNRRPSRPGEKQIHSDYESVPRNGNEVLPLFFPPSKKKKLTHMHTAQHHCPQVR